jgi:hypothetical protein
LIALLRLLANCDRLSENNNLLICDLQDKSFGYWVLLRLTQPTRLGDRTLVEQRSPKTWKLLELRKNHKSSHTDATR